MKKIVILPLLLWNLHAENFDTFMHKALQNSPYLKANALEGERAGEMSKIIQRYKNPTLSLEASRFKPDVGANASGYSTTFSQPIRLWGVSQTREKLALATQAVAASSMQLKQANFRRNLSLDYISYMQASAFVRLAKEELKIVQKIASISKERYDAGTIAKVRYLLAKVDVIRAKNRLNEKEAQKISAYWTLLALGGEKKEIRLEEKYNFIRHTQVTLNNSASIQFLQSSQQKAEQEAQLNAHKIEWLDLYATYEKEPDQSIARVGVDIPLAIFNTKKEEQRIAQLQVKQRKYLIENQNILLANTLKRLDAELEVLHKTLDSTKELYLAQKELLTMYEAGYKLANVNLIELQNIKNQIIATREKEILLQTKIDRNIVLYNYEIGEYNE